MVASDRPVVVLLHGLMGSARLWDRIAARLAAHATVLVPDLRGRGHSEGVSGYFGIRQHAADITTVLDAGAVASAVVVGHGLGFAVGRQLLAEQRDRIDGLIGVCPVELDEMIDSTDVAATTKQLQPLLSQLYATAPNERRYVEQWAQSAWFDSPGQWCEMAQRWVESTMSVASSAIGFRADPSIVWHDALDWLAAVGLDRAQPWGSAGTIAHVCNDGADGRGRDSDHVMRGDVPCEVILPGTASTALRCETRPEWPSAFVAAPATLERGNGDPGSERVTGTGTGKGKAIEPYHPVRLPDCSSADGRIWPRWADLRVLPNRNYYTAVVHPDGADAIVAAVWRVWERICA